jgi:3-hydroxyacyl-CoA dehydrogenase/enoyl-CoA hydratase/3-hydroxybutyryl-CoA epimerase
MMNEAAPDVRLDLRDGLATLIFDRPDSKVNLLTSNVMLHLDRVLDGLEDAVHRGEARALLIRSGKTDNFIAGADIDELAALEDAADARQLSRRGQAIFLRLERLPVPVLAAVHGTCVGGGLELALACDHRVASNAPRTRLGLPETRLGILPGLGGTVRLPRTVGARAALDLILTGKQIDAEGARKIGLVDRVIPVERFEGQVKALAEQLAAGKSPLGKAKPGPLDRAIAFLPPARWAIKRMSRKQLLKRTKGHYPAQPMALTATLDGLGRSPERAYEEEARAFGVLAVTPECKNLIFVFKLTEGAKKRTPEGAAARIERAAVIGAGVMGAGIAELFAYQNLPVRVVDVDEAQLRSGLDRARGLLEKGASHAGWSEDDLQERLERLSGDTGYDGFEDADVVVEAVVERMDVKRSVFSSVEDRVRPDAVIASNTSALSISELQEALQHPERVCGLHFFNPPHRMPLVEVVRGTRTSDDTMATAFRTAVQLGKTPVVVRDSAGFVVNRILGAYLTEAGHLLQQGMGVETLDRTMSRFGMPMGPARLLDEIGLDVAAHVTETLQSAFGDRFAPAPVLAAVLDTGVTGKKGGRGFYRYEDGKAKEVDPQIQRILQEGGRGDPPDVEGAKERMVFLMINEAARTLDDEVVREPGDIDVAMIMGTGFPPFRGGLLRYADSVGLAHIADRLKGFAQRLGPRFEPAAALLRRGAFYEAR